MRLAGPLLVAVGLLFATPVAAQEATPTVVLGPLTAQLYYKFSGLLSSDLLSRKPPFSGWNTVIGEGDATEPAEDLLVAARSVRQVGRRHSSKTSSSCGSRTRKAR
jgi:hypothetical protein